MTIVVWIAGLQLHYFGEVVLPISDARQKSSVQRACTGLSVLVAHPTDYISQSPAPSKIPSADSSISEGWRWA